MYLKFVKLAQQLIKVGYKHKDKLLNSNDPEFLAIALGEALQNQRKILLDTSRDQIQTITDLFEINAEIKFLTIMTSKKLNLDIKNAGQSQSIDLIASALEANNMSHAALDMRSYNTWLKDFFTSDGVKAIIEKPLTEIDGLNAGLKGAWKIPVQTTQRVVEEIMRLNNIVTEAKKEGRRLEREQRAAEATKANPPKPGQ
jgi:hypothetical protein